MAGDFNLDRLVAAVGSIGGEAMRARLSQAIGGKMLELIRTQIDQGVDCYGAPMPPRKGDGALPLQGLRNAFTASFTERGAQVSTSKWYAVVHQTGKTIRPVSASALRFRLPGGQFVSAKEVKIPKRQLVPSRAAGLGPIWEPALKRVAYQWARDNISAALKHVGEQ